MPDPETEPCAACGRPFPPDALAAHEALEQVRIGRDGVVRPPAPPVASARLIERSAGRSTWLVTRRLCPACLAAAREEEAQSETDMRRLTAWAALAAVVFAVLALAFPHLWPQVVAWLSLKPRADEKTWVRDAPPAAERPYKPPFPAAMPTAS